MAFTLSPIVINGSPPNVLDNEDLYNVIVLNGKTSPGKVVLSGHDRKVVWDVQAGPYQAGARVIFKRMPPIEFTATFSLLRDPVLGIDEFTLWTDFEKTIKATVQQARSIQRAAFGSITAVQPTPSPDMSAFSIYHPDLASREITRAVLASLGGMTYDGRGGAVVVVKFQEYAPPRAITAAVKAKAPNDPNAALKQQVNDLTNQYQATPYG